MVSTGGLTFSEEKQRRNGWGLGRKKEGGGRDWEERRQGKLRMGYKNKKIKYERKKKPDVVAGTCNPSAEKVETAGSLGS